MTTSGDLSGTPTLADYLSVLRRRKWIVLTVVVLVPLVAVLLSMRGAQMYEASAQVLLKRRAQAGFVDAARAAQTEAELARVPEVLRRSLVMVPGSGLTSLELLESSSVSPNLGSDLLTLAVRHSKPRTAERLANAYAQALETYRTDLDTQEMMRAQDGVRRQIAELEAAGLTGSAAYRNLVREERQLAAMRASYTPTTLVVQEAERATKVASTTVRNAMLGLVLGLVLAVGLAFLFDALDNRVRSVDEARDALGLRLLGKIPPPPRDLGANDLVLLADPLSYEADAFRMLRAGLDFANEKLGACTILVASASDGEGKSTTIANLAVALARADRHVVLVDFDLRSPSLHDLFDLRRQPGVADVALGEIELDAALQTVSVSDGGLKASSKPPPRAAGSLRVLPAGQALEDPDRVGADRAFAHIVEELRGADVVLVDSAPLLAIGDTLTLSAQVDALVFLMRQGALSTSMLRDVEDMLDAIGVPKLGMILTGIDTRDAYSHYPYPSRQPTDSPQAATTRSDPESAGSRAAADDPAAWHTQTVRQED